MEKPKRGTRTRSRYIPLFILTIFLLGFVLGTAVIGFFQMSPSGVVSEANVVSSQTTIPCAPIQRTYIDPVVARDGAQVGGNMGVLPTGTAMMPAGGGGNGSGMTNIPATSVASMNTNQPIGTPPYVPPTMNGPATYTPVPTMTALPNSEMRQPGMVGTPSLNQPETSLQNRMNAGEIDDNAEWDVYMTYRDNFMTLPANASPVDDVDVRQRQVIQVVNRAGEPVLGAKVEILTTDGDLIHTSCTYATGKTLFFPNIHEIVKDSPVFQVRVSKDNASTTAELRLSDDVWSLQLDVERQPANLDLLFLIDATGSMDDEIAQLTNNILYISEQIHALPDEFNVRYGLVSYKDGNYPTQVWDFTHDVQQFQSQLAQLFTAGGEGETLNDGLDRALHAVQWRGDDTVKLIFLVGDEPPGVYEDHPSYAISMLQAGQSGIKIHPIASSGLDVQGEYIFRQIAQTTMGHFIFLTYGGGDTAVVGTGDVVGSTGSDDFGEYTVEQLHEIVLNLIQEEITIAG